MKPEISRWLHPKMENISWRKMLRRLLLFLAVLVSLYHASIVYRIIRLRDKNPSTTNLIELRVESVIDSGGKPRIVQKWIPYQNISPQLVRAVLIGEDIRFFHHSGIDWMGVRLAIEKNWKEKRFVRGGSTITQQLAKNLFLSPARNPLRKLHEMLIACEMEQILGKRRILEIYLNVIEWGDGIYGAEAAARHYFGISAASLDTDQAVFLSAIIPAPLRGYSANHYSSYIRSRINMISERMTYRIPDEDRKL